MARGFGATLGTSTTDVVVSALTTLDFSGPVSVSCCINKNAAGGGGEGWLWGKQSGSTAGFRAAILDATNVLEFQVASTGTAYRWTVADTDTLIPNSTDVWVLFAWDGNPANLPAVYIDGSAETVTLAAGSGTVVTNAEAFKVGNRANSTRNFDGLISEVAVWTSKLTGADAVLLSDGLAASFVKRSTLVEYIPFEASTVTSLLLANPTVTGTAYEATHFAVDGPVLTAPTADAITSTTATIGITTPAVGGTLYWFVSTSATPPSATDLRAGTGSVDFGSFVPSATGAQTVGCEGLSDGVTYYHYWNQYDGDYYDSNIEDGTFVAADGAENAGVLITLRNIDTGALLNAVEFGRVIAIDPADLSTVATLTNVTTSSAGVLELDDPEFTAGMIGDTVWVTGWTDDGTNRFHATGTIVDLDA